MKDLQTNIAHVEFYNKVKSMHLGKYNLHTSCLCVFYFYLVKLFDFYDIFFILWCFLDLHLQFCLDFLFYFAAALFHSTH